MIFIGLASGEYCTTTLYQIQQPVIPYDMSPTEFSGAVPSGGTYSGEFVVSFQTNILITGYGINFTDLPIGAGLTISNSGTITITDFPITATPFLFTVTATNDMGTSIPQNASLMVEEVAPAIWAGVPTQQPAFLGGFTWLSPFTGNNFQPNTTFYWRAGVEEGSVVSGNAGDIAFTIISVEPYTHIVIYSDEARTIEVASC
jgi:hypothetical protein